VTPKVRILVVCAERTMRQAVLRVIDSELPADAREALNGPDAFDCALAWLPDLVVLTTELPGFDGLQLCHRLRAVAQLQDTPIIALGPRGNQAKKYQAFYVGATDYVELPFDGVEFAYRLRAPLRGRLRQVDTVDAVRCGPLQLEPATRTVHLDGRAVVLTPSEFAVLRLLATRAGTPISVGRLLSEALGHPVGLGNPQLIHTHIRNLRKKLESDPAVPSLLLRHPAGYMLAVAI
jgi:two-component system response regulator ResD